MAAASTATALPAAAALLEEDTSLDDFTWEDLRKHLNWSEARIHAFLCRKENPNAYYYRFNAPGEEQRTGAWSEEEEEKFFNLCQRGIDYRWGLFSVNFPGRVGYQCSNHYRKLVSEGLIEDPNYRVGYGGKLTFSRASGAAASSSSSGGESDTDAINLVFPTIHRQGSRSSLLKDDPDGDDMRVKTRSQRKREQDDEETDKSNETESKQTNKRLKEDSSKRESREVKERASESKQLSKREEKVERESDGKQSRRAKDDPKKSLSRAKDGKESSGKHPKQVKDEPQKKRESRQGAVEEDVKSAGKPSKSIREEAPKKRQRLETGTDVATTNKQAKRANDGPKQDQSQQLVAESVESKRPKRGEKESSSSSSSAAKPKRGGGSDIISEPDKSSKGSKSSSAKPDNTEKRASSPKSDGTVKRVPKASSGKPDRTAKRAPKSSSAKADNTVKRVPVTRSKVNGKSK